MQTVFSSAARKATNALMCAILLVFPLFAGTSGYSDITRWKFIFIAVAVSVWFAAAAVLCGAMFLGGYHLRHNRAPQAAPMAQSLSATEAEDAYMDDVLDYAMVSNHEIALYLTDAY